MHRWELKLICAAVAVVVSVVCTLLPFKLSLITCQKLRKKLAEKRQDKQTTCDHQVVYDFKCQKSADKPTSNIPISQVAGLETVSDANPQLLLVSEHRDGREAREQNQSNVDSIERTEAHISESDDDAADYKEMKYLSYLMCFGGGVFFGTFLLHMLPEVNEILDLSLLEPNSVSYPITELIIGAGFFMVLVVDQLVSTCCEAQSRKKKEREEIESSNKNCDNHADDSSCDDRRITQDGQIEEMMAETSNSKGADKQTTGDEQQNMLIGITSVYVSESDKAEDDQCMKDKEQKITEKGNNEDKVGVFDNNASYFGIEGANSELNRRSIARDTRKENSPDERNAKTEEVQKANKTHHHHQQDHHHGHSHSHNTRSIILVLALSLHHIFEGLSIGLQKNFSNVWHLTLAVLCHETAICFSMGLQFYKTDKRLTKKVLVILVVASVIMPLGILIGLGISEANHDHNGDEDPSWQNILNGVLQALATGTFIYVTFFEILLEELCNGKASLLKILLMGCGFTFMALLGLIPDSGE